ncbi:hypothetical protein [Legionella sp. CNM-4043-24]|uniref:hypothetical protein n=1 Tax=Legionella sp. CNM-4043-24 TaxID=3421646 RepID=UPI00403A95FA
MVFLVGGNAERVFRSFGRDGAIVRTPIANGTHLRRFLGSETEFDAYVGALADIADGYDAQGQMPSFFDEENEDIAAHLKKYEYAYVDREGLPCLIGLEFRDDETGKWFFTLVKNINRPLSERNIYVITSDKPSAADDVPSGCTLYAGHDAILHFKENINSGLANLFFDTALPPDRLSIDVRCSVFNQFAQQTDVTGFKKNQSLLNMLLPSDYALPASASSSSSSSRAGSIVPDPVSSALTQHAFLERLGQAGATPPQIEQVLRGEGRLIHYNSNDQATLNLATLLDQCRQKQFANMSYFVSHKGFVAAFNRLYTKPELRPFIATLLVNPCYNRADVAELIAVMASDTDLCMSMKALFNNGMSYSNLLEIARAPDRHAAVRFLTRFGLYDFTLAQIEVPGCVDMLQEAERYLSATFPIIGTNEHPYIADALRNIIQYINRTITLDAVLTHLLQPRPYSSYASFNLQLFFSKHLYMSMKRFALAAAPRANPHSSLDEKDNWLNSAIQAMPGMQAINLYPEVFSYAVETDNLPECNQEQLATTLEALGVCRMNLVSPQTLPLAELFQTPLLAERLLKFTAKESFGRFMAVRRTIRQDVLVALEQLDQHNMPEHCYQYAMADSHKAHAFRCLLNRVHDRPGMMLVFNACFAKKNMYKTQCQDNLNNTELSDAMRAANARVINEVELLHRVRCRHRGDPDNFAEMACLFASNSEQGDRFRRALELVESRCDEIARYLREAAPGSDKLHAYNRLEKDFRASMHQIVYTQLVNPQNDNLAEQITRAAEPVKELLNEDRHLYLRRCLKGIANTLLLIVSLPTCFYFNRRHKERTGDFLFYSRAKSGEMLNEAVQQLPSILLPPATH